MIAKDAMTSWALVPARGGSKSIPYKNLALLAGLPLLDYGVGAVQASQRCARIVGSTDDARIEERFNFLGVECDRRPGDLAADNTPVAEVAREWLKRMSAAGSTLPEVLVLVQPTSPFLRPDHVCRLLDAVATRADIRSAQTIVECPHNAHAWNQRIFDDGLVQFAHAAERKRGYNKQVKPKRWLFGNLVAVRVTALLSGEDFFATPSVGVKIDRPYDFDLDTAVDLALAEAMLVQGIVQLPHICIAVANRDSLCRDSQSSMSHSTISEAK